MKMPEKHDLLAAILVRMNKASGQLLRLQWRTFAADILAGGYKQDRRNDVRHYRLVHS